MDLDQLAREVSQAIETYTYDYPPGMLGQPWDAGRIAAHLDAMRGALVLPRWALVALRDTIEQIRSAEPAKYRCAIVADDRKGTFLVFDVEDKAFMLARDDGNGLESFGVRGDVVGCFMAR